MRISNNIITVLLLGQIFFFTNVFSQFSFVHISDIHVSDVSSVINNPDIDGVKFKQMIDKINTLVPKPAFVVASGDISNVGSYGDGMYEVLTQYLYPQPLTNPQYGNYYIDAAQTIPIYFVPGNHDYYSTTVFIPSVPDLLNYAANTSPVADFAINYQNSVIIFLLSGYDQYRPVWIDNNLSNPEGSGLSMGQCNYLRSMLLQNTNSKKIIVMHHPPVNAVGTNADGSPSTGTIVDVADGSIINNRDIFLNICDSTQVDMVLAGHVHQNLVADRNGNVVDENYTGGTRYIQTAACIYGGYRVITVDSSFVWADDAQQLIFAGIPENNNEYSADSFTITSDPDSKTITINCLFVYKSVDANISLFNMSGQEVCRQHEKIYSGRKIMIPTDNLPKGIYLLRLPEGKEVSGTKVAIY